VLEKKARTGANWWWWSLKKKKSPAQAREGSRPADLNVHRRGGGFVAPSA
jgi:hypothetical protein